MSNLHPQLAHCSISFQEEFYISTCMNSFTDFSQNLRIESKDKKIKNDNFLPEKFMFSQLATT